MTYNNDGPIYSMLSGKGPVYGCGAAANCPEGYCRMNLCDTDGSLGSTMLNCGYPSQVNCYSYTESGFNCVSYCDNV